MEHLESPKRQCSLWALRGAHGCWIKQGMPREARSDGVGTPAFPENLRNWDRALGMISRPQQGPNVPVLISRILTKNHWQSQQQVPEQMTLASSWWPQLWTEKAWCWHWPSEVSLPWHCTLSRKMLPTPSPKWLFPRALTPSPQSSCRHTTWASSIPQRSSQTVPHVPLWWTSTLPSHRFFPFTNLIMRWPGEDSEISPECHGHHSGLFFSSEYNPSKFQNHRNSGL